MDTIDREVYELVKGDKVETIDREVYKLAKGDKVMPGQEIYSDEGLKLFVGPIEVDDTILYRMGNFGVTEDNGKSVKLCKNSEDWHFSATLVCHPSEGG